MLVSIAECKPGGKVWRYYSRSPDNKKALRIAIRKIFGVKRLFKRNRQVGGTYGSILQREISPIRPLSVVLEKVRVTFT